MKIKKLVLLCICGVVGTVWLTSCTPSFNINATPGVRDLSVKPQNDSIRATVSAPIPEDSTQMLLSVKSGLTKKKEEPYKMYNLLSMHLGVGSMKAEAHGTGGTSSNDARVTLHIDYEHYLKKFPGLALGGFFFYYPEREEADTYYDYDFNLDLCGIGPQVLYKVKFNKFLLLGASVGGGLGIVETYYSESGNYYDREDSETALGAIYTLNVGIEFLVSKQWVISLKYNHLGGSFSDKDVFNATPDGKMKYTRNAFLVGAGFYF